MIGGGDSILVLCDDMMNIPPNIIFQSRIFFIKEVQNCRLSLDDKKSRMTMASRINR
jgi:hypothetical protein